MTIALGVGASTAIFSVVDAVLLQPLPNRDPDRLVFAYGKMRKRDVTDLPLSSADFLDLRSGAQASAIVVTVATAVIIARQYRSGQGSTCWSDPFIDFDGKCTYTGSCYGTHDCIDTEYKRDPSSGGGCPAMVREFYHWSYWNVFGNVTNASCTTPVYSTTSSCECR